MRTSVPRGTSESVQGEGAENVANAEQEAAQNAEAAAMVDEMKKDDPAPAAEVRHAPGHVSAAVKAWVRREIHLLQLGKSEETRGVENP